MKKLKDLFNKYDCDKGHKHQYDRIYEKIFNPVKDEPLNICLLYTSDAADE